MALILNLETSTTVCSVALAKDGVLVSKKEIKTEKFSHSENLNLFIIDVMAASEFELKDLEAIAVSKGPGSYTGLRIGVSTAKGLCYGLGIPLLAINSLKALANMVQGFEGLICPLFDARRMEVYSAIYNQSLEEIEAVSAIVLETDSYNNYLDESEVLFVGPGAQKTVEFLEENKNLKYDSELEVSAIGMMSLAENKFKLNDFEDLAYFEPFYLKDFIAGKPKKLL